MILAPAPVAIPIERQALQIKLAGPLPVSASFAAIRVNPDVCAAKERNYSKPF